MGNNTMLTELFGTDVFNQKTMEACLDAETYASWKNCIDNGCTLELSVANKIAETMKNWAVEKGATHYTHWFQPMTGITAEKHEAFMDLDKQGNAILSFSGKALVRGEPDASSFPNGGLRSTFEARGYTAWDPRSFAFVRDNTLFIPTCFFSYTGAALDMKTPLLRSMEEVSKEGIRILRLLGDTKTNRIIPCVGAEQEYFLLPKHIYNQRPDLQMTGRTLFGAPAPKSQELDDHYLGSIKSSVLAYMQDVDLQLWRLGILSKIRHNEAAPCQHELAPMYSDANSACDGNQLIMQVLKSSADKHGLVCLLHEKPFQGVNGSGKHNNWSLSTDSGKNLLLPGNTPEQNARFLIFLAAFMKGIDEYQDFLRATVCGSGNDHRLGANEAPPAILSIFLGSELFSLVNAIAEHKPYSAANPKHIRIGVDALPPIPQDTTDRNRTAPMAFTGNKFEFRMVGSSQSISECNIAINTIMAETLGKFADELESATDLESAIQELVSRTFAQHRHILFEGNGYSHQWTQEAERRGLTNNSSTAEALAAYTRPKNIDLVTSRKIFSKEEYQARYDVQMQAYKNICTIEARTMIDIVIKQIIPAVIAYTKELTDSVIAKSSVGLSCSAEKVLADKLCDAVDRIYQNCIAMDGMLADIPTNSESAVTFCKNVIAPQLTLIRQDADLLEKNTAKTHWPFPDYSELFNS